MSVAGIEDFPDLSRMLRRELDRIRQSPGSCRSGCSEEAVVTKKYESLVAARRELVRLNSTVRRFP